MFSKRIKQTLSKGLVLLTLFTGTFTFSALTNAREAEAVMAKTKTSVNFRTGPSTGYSVIRTLPTGTAIDVRTHNSSWSKVTSSGRTGYLVSRYINFTTTGKTTSRVNLRSSGSTNARSLVKIPSGATVTVLAGPVNGWYKVRWSGMTGFIYKSYVRVSGSTSTQLSSSSASTSTSGSYPGYTKMTWNVTFYTNLAKENGGYTITALGTNLRYGVLASNYWPMRSKVILPNWGEFTVEDRGGSNFDSKYRLDMLIPRNSGESEYQYYTRVNNMGIKSITGYIKPNN